MTSYCSLFVYTKSLRGIDANTTHYDVVYLLGRNGFCILMVRTPSPHLSTDNSSLSYHKIAKYGFIGEMNISHPVSLCVRAQTNFYTFYIETRKLVIGPNQTQLNVVGWVGLNGPLRQYCSLYLAVSQREGERK